MITNNGFAFAGAKLHQFMELLDDVAGVDVSSLTMSVTVNIGDEKAIFELHPDKAAIRYPEMDHVFFDVPSKKEVTAAFEAYRQLYERTAGMRAAQALVAAVANNGHAYVENTPSIVIDTFLKIWSDAYGEDRPDLFLKMSKAPKTGEIFHTGYIKTRLTPEKIAAMKNEDGDDDYRPEPLFPANKIKEDKPNA